VSAGATPAQRQRGGTLSRRRSAADADPTVADEFIRVREKDRGFFETPIPSRQRPFQRLLLNVTMRDMMVQRIPRECRVPRRRRRTELGHERIGACRIRIALLAFTVVAGHRDAAKAEKDCSGDYAERFHCGISKVDRAMSPATEVCGLAAGTIKLPLR
jgi:hypothetical protein